MALARDGAEGLYILYRFGEMLTLALWVQTLCQVLPLLVGI